MALALGFSLAACGPSGDEGAVFSIRDSAGIRIVRNSPDASADSCAIASEPAVTIGGRGDSLEAPLYNVVDGTRLSDGRIAALSQRGAEVRVYDSRGRLLRAFGRAGDGPGEFNLPLRLWHTPGDTLVVGDQGPWSFLLFSPEGDPLGRIVPRPAVANTPEVMGTTRDGTLVLGQECCRSLDEAEFQEQRLHLVAWDASGALSDTLGVYPSGRQGLLSEEIGLVGRPVFEPRARAAVGNDGIAVGLGDRREMRLLSPDGTLRTIVRWTGPSLDVSRSEVEAYREQVLARYSELPPSARRFAEPQVSEDRPVAERFPAHSAIIVDETGAIWVSRFPRPTWPEDDDLRWLVFRSDGRFLCHARMPAALESEHSVRDIDEKFVLARVTDQLDVAYLHAYPLRRPGRTHP